MLIDREKELAELNFLLQEPGAHFVTLSGRRRLGKTTLLVEWVRQSEYPALYWVGSRIAPTQLLRTFSQAVYRIAHPRLQPDEEFSYSSWSMALRQLADTASRQRLLVVLDEFPYAAEVVPGLPSVLQNAWDHYLKETQIYLVLCGSHIGMMERLQARQAPLFGRIEGQIKLGPIPFYAIKDFLPSYSLEERVEVYAVLGGVPAYLERFNDKVSLQKNIKRHIFNQTGLYRTDPLFLLQDELQQPQSYLGILLAIAQGNHSSGEISRATGIENVTPYLAKLQALHFIERRLPATIPEEMRSKSRRGRYHFADSYLRFYYRFIYPNQHLLEQGLHENIWTIIENQLPHFTGLHAFEDLCRQWIWEQARQQTLPFIPRRIGSHWSNDVQIDVVAINWQEKQILLGEAKWTQKPIRRAIVEKLINKMPLVLPDEALGWQVHYAFFARNGFTEKARALAQRHDASLISLDRLGDDLHLS